MRVPFRVEDGDAVEADVEELGDPTRRRGVQDDGVVRLVEALGLAPHRLVDLAGRCTDLWRIIVVNTWGARDDAVEVMRVVELIIVSSVYYCYLQV